MLFKSLYKIPSFSTFSQEFVSPIISSMICFLLFQDPLPSNPVSLAKNLANESRESDQFSSGELITLYKIGIKKSYF
jgi:hypothetical protein